MTSLNLAVGHRPAGHRCARRRIERAIARFPEQHRMAVAALAARDDRIADLAQSFPALLFALAVPRPGIDAEPVLADVTAGTPLRDLAASARVPMWLRKLPPEAFAMRLAPLPDSELLRLQIANYLPRPGRAALWLAAVSEAARWGDASFVLWIARVAARAKRERDVRLREIRSLSLLAFYSHADTTLGRTLIETPWHASMSMATAEAACDTFLDRARLYLYVGETPRSDAWFEAGCIDGYEFRPLATSTEIADEAVAMGNCLRTYGCRIAGNRVRIWSVRRDGQRIATLEIGHRRFGPLPGIGQLRTMNNKECDAQLWWAALRWMHGHDLRKIETCAVPWNKLEFDRTRWVDLWRPFWLARRRIPCWLTLCPDRRGLWKI